MPVLPDGSHIAGAVVEILRIPADERTDDEPAAPYLLREFTALLGELYQVFDWRRSEIEAICVELAWFARPVANQPLGAEIQLTLAVRVLGAGEAAVTGVAQHTARVIGTAAGAMGYDYSLAPFATYVAARSKLSKDVLLSVAKRGEWVELQAGSVPEAYTFDVVPAPARHMGRLASALAESPRCAIIVQLIPTSLTASESEAIGFGSTVLSTLSGGVADPVMGQIAFETAARTAESYRHFERVKHSALFQYSLLVQGSNDGAALLASRLHGYMLGEDEGVSLRTEIDPVTSQLDTRELGALTEPWRLQAEILANRVDREDREHALQRFPHLMTAGEAATLFRLPILDDNVGAGFEQAHLSRVRRNYSAGVVGGAELVFGVMRTPGHQVEIGLSLNDLTKHVFVAGTPGSGKTNFTIGLVHELWHQHGIPSLVIEPAKSEYRSLLKAIPELQVFTPGNASLAPFVLNPFRPPDGVQLERHKHALTTAFEAGVSMASPLNQIFADSVDLTFAQAGWFDHQTPASGGATISINEFIATYQSVFEDIGYVGEAQNIGRAGLVRLRSLQRYFDTYPSIPVQSLLRRPTVIELGALENARDKALFIAMILLNVMTYAAANFDTRASGLRNLLVLEEAHVLLDAGGTRTGEGEGDAVGVAKELMRRMLAEIRSSGVGVVIADQSPRAVGNDVLALTNVKVGFRMVEADDQEMFGASVGMTDSQRRRLGTLRPGEATVFFDRLDSPEEILTPNYRDRHDIPISISDDDVRLLNQFWVENRALLYPYPQCKLIPWNPTVASAARQIGRVAYQSLSRPLSKEQISHGIKDAIARAQAGFPTDSGLPAMAVLCFLRTVHFEGRRQIPEQTMAATLRSVARR